ncbi:MAG: DUF1015 domain-containing protein [Actinomycetota bacterium]
MPEVTPFRGLRYDPLVAGDLSTVVSPPYDVISPTQREQFEALSPYNVVRLVLPQPVPGGPDQTRYERARAQLDEWVSSGVLRRDDRESLYVYEQRYVLDGVRRTQRGILAAVTLAEPADGGVLPHERTYAKIVEDRLSLLRAAETNLDCVFCVYDSDDAAAHAAIDAAASAEPAAQFTTPDGIEHLVWCLSDPQAVGAVTRAIEKASVVIADGHHRWRTAQTYRDERRAIDGPGPWDAKMTFLVDASRFGPSLLPIHRVVEGITSEDALARLSAVFDIEPAAGDPKTLAAELAGRQTGGRTFCMLDASQSWWLTLRDHAAEAEAMPANRSQAWRDLDVSVLHALVFDRLLDGITPHFVHSPVEAVEEISQGRATLAFLLAPMPFDAVRAVAEAGDAMPQKSTYFIPKPATGVVLRPLD